MAKPIVLCADSTCDLSPELIEKYHVHIKPLHIILEGESHDDGVDITPDQIYDIYREKNILPTTSAVNVEEYKEMARPFIEAGNDVIHINLGSGISTSYNSCRIAAEETPGLYAIDSGNLSTGMGLVVIAAAERIAAGMPVEQIVSEVQEFTKHVEASFVIDTLEFLHKGGRCSTLAMLGANLLKLKPCIEVNNADSSMTVGKKYRGSLDKALQEYVKDRLEGRTNIRTNRIFITHSGISDERVELVKNAIRQYQNFDEIIVTRAGCTITSHCGPNTLGILFVRKG